MLCQFIFGNYADSSCLLNRLANCTSVNADVGVKSVATLFPFWLLALAMQLVDRSGNGAFADERPNVIVILTDDQGWGDVSFNGNPNLSTPNIDSLARDGARMDHFYVCSVCSPTRAEFLTGRYHTRMGVYSTSAGGERFNADEQTIAEAFSDAGYATAAYGKWHSGMQWPYHPNARGFDDYYGFCSGHWGNYFDPMLEHNGEVVKGEGFLVDDLTNRTIDFIEAHRNEPFFVYLPYNTPHSPMQVPDQYWERFKDKPLVADPAPENAKKQKDDHTRAALAMCENIDWNVGRLLTYLDESKLAENTIVAYFSDNGPNGSRFNAGMRGRKGSTHEGGLRSPLVMRFPKSITPGTTIDEVTAAIDLLPTLADLCKVELKSEKPLDGQSFANQLTGSSMTTEPRLVFSNWKSKLSVRSGQFRKQSGGGLFDIQKDPRETVDLAGELPEVANRLQKAMDDWVAEVKPITAANEKLRPITIGHPKARWTQLPARDAEVSGGAGRSNRFPNCTFVQDWTNLDDQIVWEADILADGDFEVTMYYACDESDVGSTIELSMGDDTLRTKIDQANETPLIGSEHDRVERAEGYVKDWKPIKLGRIHLSAGRGKLTLKATEVAGKEVAQMRLLMLERVGG